MPMLPIRVSTLMNPLVDVERNLEQGIARMGLPTIPGPMAVTQQMVASVESAIEGLPEPATVLQQIIPTGLPAFPTFGPPAQPEHPQPQAQAPPAPRAVRIGKLI